MNTIKKLIIINLLFLFIMPVYPASIFDPPYKKLAEDIMKTVNREEKNMVAVISFHSLDNDDSGEGELISEEIIYELIKNGTVHVVERKQISNIMEELQFNQTGAIDAATAKKIGNGLGADVLVIGNYTAINEREYKVYAKVVDPETFKVLGAHQQVVKRIKHDKEAAARKKERQEAMWSKFELGLITGLTIPQGNVGGSYSVNDTGLFTSNSVTQTFENISLEPSLPLAIRTTFWLNKVFGIGGDIGYTYFKFAPQEFTVTSTDTTTTPQTYVMNESEYFQFNHVYMSFNFLLRIPILPTLFPYLGIGYKFSLQSVSHVGTGNDLFYPISNTELGIDLGWTPNEGTLQTILNLFTYMVGIEWFFTENIGLMAEYQYINFGETRYFIPGLNESYELVIDPIVAHVIHTAIIFKF